ncbi:hypothetical protein Tco_0968897 [Tanacetum coccineum]
MGNLYKNDKLLTFNPHHITIASFSKTPSASEVPLTSYMLQVAKLSTKAPEKTLLLSFWKVNTDNTADKSLSDTVVQCFKFKKQVTKPQHVEEPMATADIPKSLDASESPEEVANQPSTAATKNEHETKATENVVEEKMDTDVEITFMGDDDEELGDSDNELSVANEVVGGNVIDEILTEVNTEDTTIIVFATPNTEIPFVSVSTPTPVLPMEDMQALAARAL